MWFRPWLQHDPSVLRSKLSWSASVGCMVRFSEGTGQKKPRNAWTMTHREYAGGIRQRRFQFEQIKMVLKARQHGFTLFVFHTCYTYTCSTFFINCFSSRTIFFHCGYPNASNDLSRQSFPLCTPAVQIPVPKHVASGHWVFNLLANGKFDRKVKPLLKPPFVMHDVSKTKIETTMNWGPSAMHDSQGWWH